MPRRNTTIGTAIMPAGPREYRFGDHVIEALQIHHHRDFHAPAAGPWCDEADKIAWIDRATGLPCIILRADDGHLRGFVAVAPGHPLFGYAHRAIPLGLGIEVHGGLDYAEPCEEGVEEERSVCHVTGPVLHHQREAWWFGFSCDKSYDLVPGRVDRRIDAEPREYRDEAYVHRQIVQLAAQLAAIDMGLPIIDVTNPPPPIGLDPSEGGRP